MPKQADHGHEAPFTKGEFSQQENQVLLDYVARNSDVLTGDRKARKKCLDIIFRLFQEKGLKRSRQQLKKRLDLIRRASKKVKSGVPDGVQYERRCERQRDKSHNAQTSMSDVQDLLQDHEDLLDAFEKRLESLLQDMEKRAEQRAAVQQTAVAQALQQASARQEALLAVASQAVEQAHQDTLEMAYVVHDAIQVTIEQTIMQGLLHLAQAAEQHMEAALQDHAQQGQAAPQPLDLFPTVGVESAPQQVPVEEAAHLEIEEADDDINLDLHL